MSFKFFSRETAKIFELPLAAKPGQGIGLRTSQPQEGPMNDLGLRLAQSALAVASFLAILALTGLLHY